MNRKIKWESASISRFGMATSTVPACQHAMHEGAGRVLIRYHCLHYAYARHLFPERVGGDDKRQTNEVFTAHPTLGMQPQGLHRHERTRVTS